MRTSRYLAFAAVAATLLATPAIAHADPATAAGAVLTVGSTTGPNVNPGDGLSAGLKSGTQARFTSSAGGSTGVFCNASAFVGTVSSNPSAPGTASGSVTTQNFTSCTTNIIGTTSVTSITVDNLPYTVSISSATKLATVSGSVQTTVRLRTIFGTTATCIYRPTGTITGTTSNTDNSLTFTNQQFSRQTGSSSLCFTSAFWSTTYQPVVDTSQGNGRVFVN